MDSFWTQIRNMTFWNWLALIAFFIALLGGINAFLSLKSRYKDWKGTKNKKQFENRLAELEKELTRLEEFRNEPQKLYMHILRRVLRILLLFFTACFWFGIAFGFSVFPLSESSSEMFAFGHSLWVSLLMYGCVLLTISLLKFVRTVSDPKMFAQEVLSFIGEGDSRGFKVDKDSNLMRFAGSVEISDLLKETK